MSVAVRLFEVFEYGRSEGKERERGGNVTSDVAKWGRGKGSSPSPCNLKEFVKGLRSTSVNIHK